MRVALDRGASTAAEDESRCNRPRPLQPDFRPIARIVLASPAVSTGDSSFSAKGKPQSSRGGYCVARNSRRPGVSAPGARYRLHPVRGLRHRRHASSVFGAHDRAVDGPQYRPINRPQCLSSGKRLGAGQRFGSCKRVGSRECISAGQCLCPGERFCSALGNCRRPEQLFVRPQSADRWHVHRRMGRSLLRRDLEHEPAHRGRRPAVPLIDL